MMFFKYTWVLNLLLFFCYACTSTTTENVEVETQTKENTEVAVSIPTEKTSAVVFIEGDYSGFKFSKDGAISVFTNKGGDQLFVKKQDGNIVTIAEGNSIGSNYDISEDGAYVYYREKTPDYKMYIQQYEIATGKKNTLHHLSPYTDLSSLSLSDTTYFLGGDNMQIMASNGIDTWNLNEKQGFYQIAVSPNLNYIYAHLSSFIYLIDVKTGEAIQVGQGLACDWSFDGNYILGFKDETLDGHSISGSDLFVIDVATKKMSFITETSDRFEMNPSFKSEHEIVYQDELNHQIYQKTIQL